MRIMLYTDPPVLHAPPSAYGKVGWQIFKALEGKHEVAVTPGGGNHLGRFKWGDLFIYESGDEGRFSEDMIESNCYHFNADAVIVLKDLFAFKNLHTMPLECIYYVPVDHENLHPIYDRLKSAFKVVAMSEFGKKELERKDIDVETVIPHGVNPENYFPVEGVERENAKRFFKLDPYKFTIGFIGRNQVRKQVPRLLQAVRRLLDREPELEEEMQVLLWTDVRARRTGPGSWRGTELMHVISDLGLGNVISWPNSETYDEGIPEDQMWRFYNACDVVCGVGNEGFWLPKIEAAACGIPTIHVDHAAGAEDAQFTAKVEGWTYHNPSGLKQPLVDLDDMADKILHVYNSDWERLRGEQLERAEKYYWENITPKWVDLISECGTELRPLITSEGVRSWDQRLE